MYSKFDWCRCTITVNVTWTKTSLIWRPYWENKCYKYTGCPQNARCLTIDKTIAFCSFEFKMSNLFSVNSEINVTDDKSHFRIFEVILGLTNQSKCISQLRFWYLGINFKFSDINFKTGSFSREPILGHFLGDINFGKFYIQNQLIFKRSKMWNIIFLHCVIHLFGIISY